ncbi:hypothetical protein AB5I41_09995 [Sphingomonas sp. MMS24-JH45]
MTAPKQQSPPPRPPYRPTGAVSVRARIRDRPTRGPGHGRAARAGHARHLLRRDRRAGGPAVGPDRLLFWEQGGAVLRRAGARREGRAGAARRPRRLRPRSSGEDAAAPARRGTRLWKTPYLDRFGEGDDARDATPERVARIAADFIRPLTAAQSAIIDEEIAAGLFRPVDKKMLFYFSVVGAADAIHSSRFILSSVYGVEKVTTIFTATMPGTSPTSSCAPC